MSKGNLKKSFTNAQFKSGAYSTVITVIVIALVVVANLIFHHLDLSKDLTSDGLFTLSKETVSMLKSVKDDVTIYYMVTKGEEQEYVDRVLKKYNKISDHVKLVKKDPVVSPGFAKKYVDEEIASGDVIVVNEKTGAAKYVSADEMYYTNDLSYYGYGQETYLDAEGQVTSAIQSVSSGGGKKIYMVTGHSEQELTDTLLTSLEKMNIEVENISLVTEKQVPDDCTLLVLDGPQTDLRDSEADQITEYLKAGGSALIMPAYTQKETPNVDAVLKEYSIQIKRGIIYEGAGHYEQYLDWIVPEINSEAEMMSKFDENDFVVMGAAQALDSEKETKLRNGLTITDLLTTSKQSLLKVDPSSEEIKKEKGDLDGPFCVAKYAEEKADGSEEADTTRLTVIATNQVQDILLQNIINAMIDSESGTDTVSVAARNLSYSSVKMGVTSQILWAVVLIILIPLTLLLSGFGIWFTRRRK